MRREFPRSIKEAAWYRAGGRCETCGMDLQPGKIAYDHVNPDGLTGKPTLENCRVLCVPCHKEKTKADVADIARAKRREAKHLGIKTRRGPPIPGSRASGWKRKINGQVERRI